MLHLATHGFFLPPPPPPSSSASVALARAGATDEVRTLPMADTDSAEDATLWRRFREQGPMRRSGVALAGANDTLAGRRPAGAADDGILTAEEVVGIDLWGTALVTLSACDTGLGEAADTEGVYGLRRAFVLAGARNLIMTLWGVDDEASAALMAEVYRHVTSREPAPRALLAAQRAYVAAERRAGRYPHPFYWAPFVASGVGTGLEPAPQH